MNQVVTQNAKPNVVTLDEAQNQSQGMIAVEQSRAVQEVQASLVIAKRFPRDEVAAARKINNACLRPGLADVATYEYSKGGATVTGPSIRLAETIAQYWGNIDFGWKEIDRKPGESTVQAYCWDKESNTRREQTFAVKHIIDTKGGGKVLTDERSIYENNANMAARRMRACILAMIPGDIIEDAVKQCEQTLLTKEPMTKENLKGMLDAFAAFGVNKAMIEGRIQRGFEAIVPAQVVKMRSVYNSIKDGMSKPEDWFDFSLAKGKDSPKADKKKAAEKPDPTPEDENKEQLENFKEAQAKKAASKPEAKSTIVKKSLPPVEFPKDQDGYPIDNGQGDGEPE